MPARTCFGQAFLAAGKNKRSRAHGSQAIRKQRGNSAIARHRNAGIPQGTGQVLHGKQERPLGGRRCVFQLKQRIFRVISDRQSVRFGFRFPRGGQFSAEQKRSDREQFHDLGKTDSRLLRRKRSRHAHLIRRHGKRQQDDVCGQNPPRILPVRPEQAPCAHATAHPPQILRGVSLPHVSPDYGYRRHSHSIPSRPSFSRR